MLSNSTLLNINCTGIITMRKLRISIVFAACAALFALTWISLLASPTQLFAQGERTPIPLITLVPPTPLPSAEPPTAAPTFTRSAIEGIVKRGTLRIGIMYNIGRFATLSDTGEVRGYEADIARAIAEDWGVKPEFVQVTRKNGLSMLLSGEVDLLMGQQMLTREDQSFVDFSDPLFMNTQVALVASDVPAQSIRDLSNQPVAVVAGSRGEQAFNGWMIGNGLKPDTKPFVLLDEALQALIGKEVVAVVGDRWDLDEKVRGKIDSVRLLPEPFRSEPYAIAMRRYDANMRTLVNRTLQRLVAIDRFSSLYDLWFPKDLLPVEGRVVPRVWKDLSTDSRAIADFSVDIVMPSAPVIAKIKAGQPIRVAGLGAPSDPTGAPPLLESFDQALINEMARRWGVQVQIVPDTFGRGEDAVASGQADLAVGVEPHWSSIDRVDFVGIFAQHGYKMMTPFGSSAVRNFGDLFATQRLIAYFRDDPAAIDLAKKLAETVRINVDTIKPVAIDSIEEAVQRLTSDPRVNVVFADSLRLIPIVTAYPKSVQLTDGEYGDKKPIGFAVPRNDVDFRVLIDVTLQDMYRDGTYANIYKANFNLGEPLQMVVWPGPPQVFGVKTSQ
jgi:ABC-type amino acid transport substrate-binding protein